MRFYTGFIVGVFCILMTAGVSAEIIVGDEDFATDDWGIYLEVDPAVASTPFNQSFNETYTDGLYWRLDGTNDGDVSADWNHFPYRINASQFNSFLGYGFIQGTYPTGIFYNALETSYTWWRNGQGYITLATAGVGPATTINSAWFLVNANSTIAGDRLDVESITNFTEQVSIAKGNGKIVTSNAAGGLRIYTDNYADAGHISFSNTADIGISTGDGVVDGYDYDGAFILRQKTSNPSEVGEFIFIEEAGDWRFALPKAQADLGTYNPRSMIIAGASVNNASNFNCTYWGADNIDCNTGVTGADLFVQDDIEFDGLLYGNGSQLHSLPVSGDSFNNTNVAYLNNTQIFTKDNRFDSNVTINASNYQGGFKIIAREEIPADILTEIEYFDIAITRVDNETGTLNQKIMNIQVNDQRNLTTGGSGATTKLFNVKWNGEGYDGSGNLDSRILFEVGHQGNPREESTAQYDCAFGIGTDCGGTNYDTITYRHHGTSGGTYRYTGLGIGQKVYLDGNVAGVNTRQDYYAINIDPNMGLMDPLVSNAPNTYNFRGINFVPVMNPGLLSPINGTTYGFYYDPNFDGFGATTSYSIWIEDPHDIVLADGSTRIRFDEGATNLSSTSGDLEVNGVDVCLEDGSNCPTNVVNSSVISIGRSETIPLINTLYENDKNYTILVEGTLNRSSNDKDGDGCSGGWELEFKIGNSTDQDTAKKIADRNNYGGCIVTTGNGSFNYLEDFSFEIAPFEYWTINGTKRISDNVLEFAYWNEVRL